jgi:hypothetical protein
MLFVQALQKIDAPDSNTLAEQLARAVKLGYCVVSPVLVFKGRYVVYLALLDE